MNSRIINKLIIGISMCFLFITAMTACGSSEPDGIGYGEEFTVADNTYKLDKIVEVTDSQTGGTEQYEVQVLMSTQSAPVQFSMGTDGTTGTPQSLITIELNGDDTKYTTNNIRFKAADEGGFKGMATFIFTLPDGVDFPATGTFLYTGEEEESVPLDFSEMKIETVETVPAEEPAS